MFKESKPSHRFTAFFVMLIACFAAACQPTPDKPAVISKSADLMERVLNASGAELDMSKRIIEQQIQELGSHIKLQINPSTQVTIHVDADITSRGLQKIPLVRTRPMNLSKEHFDTLNQCLTKGNPLYHDTYYGYDDEDITINGLTHEEIVASVARLKQYAQNDSLSAQDRYFLDEYIRDLEDLSQYDLTLSIADLIPYDGNLIEEIDNSYYSHITNLKCFLDKDRSAWVNLLQSINSTRTQYLFFCSEIVTSYNHFEPYEGIDAQRMNVSYAYAKSMAEDLVRKADGSDSNLMVYESSIAYQIDTITGYTIETSPQAYAFYFARSYNGIEIKPVEFPRGLQSGSVTIDYNKRIAPEIFIVLIDNEGVVRAIWRNYTEHIEMVAADVPLLDFKTILEIFEQQVRQKYAWIKLSDSLPSDLGITFRVKKIELNLTVIPEKNNLDNYITVPVWDFIADMTYDEDIYDEYGHIYKGEMDISILTVNAIDGTIINREQGF